MEDRSLGRVGKRKFAQRSQIVSAREAGCHLPIWCSAEQTLIQEVDFKLSDDRGVEPGFSTHREFPKLFSGACLGPLMASPGMLSSVSACRAGKVLAKFPGRMANKETPNHSSPDVGQPREGTSGPPRQSKQA